MALKIVNVDDGFEKAFWNHVNKDPFDYHFFIFDFKQRREKTKVLLALEDGKIAGLMLLYAGEVVQLRGSRRAVKLLLDEVDFERVELQAPLDCEDIVLERYRPWFRHELVLMRLDKGQERVQVKHVLVKLGVEDAESVARVLKEADPVVWGDTTAERMRVTLSEAFPLGIKRDGKLVSYGHCRFVDFGSSIGAIATDEHHRNMGYATSVVSGLVEEILKHSATALIYVLKENAPAVRVYSKVGFRPYKHYLMIKANRIGD